MRTILRRYCLLFISIFIVGTGITLITNAGLGATAVTSLPYVISQLWSVSFGFMTGLFNVLWVILQMVIQRKKVPKIQILQFLVAFVLGFSVDLSNILLGFIQPENYFSQILMLIIGSLILAFGVFLQLEAKAVYNPAEGIVAVISKNTSYPFGTIKTLFDSTLVILSILLGFIVTGRMVGIREGTIISALIIGPFTGMFQKIFK